MPNTFIRSVTAAALVCGATLARADPIFDFYAGKTVSIISGFTPSGEFDTYFRLLGRHMGKHIPGKPQVVNSNLPGAGTLIAANNLYNKVAPDGLTISTFTALDRSLDSSATRFTALVSRSREKRRRLSLPLGMTRS